MVFLRPMVVRDAQASDRLSLDRYELMRTTMQAAQPAPSGPLPITEAAQMPALRETPFLTLPAAGKR